MKTVYNTGIQVKVKDKMGVIVGYDELTNPVPMYMVSMYGENGTIKPYADFMVEPLTSPEVLAKEGKLVSYDTITAYEGSRIIISVYEYLGDMWYISKTLKDNRMFINKILRIGTVNE